ncbi:MAG: glycosyltransferase family 2 protein, partial [Pseudomonadota bacterium]
AEATLARCLDHLAWHGATIIVIDNGSTDASRDIVRDAGNTVAELRDDPFTGAFDLTHQLRLKRDIIATLGTGWVLHADADEFIDTPDKTPLSEFLTYWMNTDVTAFPCREVMYLPKSEADQHMPDTFQDTMKACLRIADRDPKQRVFRADAPLDRWMATGGHTVTRPTEPVPDTALTLRHFFGLSLDQIRAEYLGRVYAPENLGKLWHRASSAGEITTHAPPKGMLYSPETVADTPAHRRVPVFRSRPVAPAVAADPSANVELVTTCAATQDQVSKLAAEMFPGLRLSPIASNAVAMRPRLLVAEHPALDCPKGNAAIAHGENWLRRIAGGRQAGFVNGTPYAELRLEDLEEIPGLLQHALRRLLSGSLLSPVLAETEPVRSRSDYAGRLKAITGRLAADFGYA